MPETEKDTRIERALMLIKAIGDEGTHTIKTANLNGIVAILSEPAPGEEEETWHSL